MVIRWNEEKNNTIKRDRHMSFERIAEAISSEKYLDVVKHPRRPNQRMFIVRLDGYVWVVPYVIEADGETIFLKTAFRSRKLNRKYGERQDE